MFSEFVILDLSTVLAGPSVATFFAEQGAKVIKIENTNVPDVTRSWKLPSENQDSAISAYFSSINFKKEYIQLNLKYTNNRNEFLKLVASADMVISNFKLGDEEKFGIQDSELRKINPNLICGKITGFGDDSDRVAYDLILQAETGFMSMNGTPESGPVKMPVALIDVLAAHHLKEALLLAILKLKTTGIAKTVTVSLYDAAICSLVNQASNYLMEKHIPQRIGSLHPNIAPYGEIFNTKNGDLITFAIGSDVHFKKLCSFLNLTNLIELPDFTHNSSRVKNREKLQTLLQDKLLEFTSNEILSAMAFENVPCGKINNLNEVFESSEAKKLVREEVIDGKITKRVTSIAFKWK
jgi:crotonobetainyl-CoA:carnitine CoA-transferase CaiB-like acyl-CoA transferase